MPMRMRTRMPMPMRRRCGEDAPGEDLHRVAHLLQVGDAPPRERLEQLEHREAERRRESVREGVRREETEGEIVI